LQTYITKGNLPAASPFDIKNMKDEALKRKLVILN